MHACTPQPCKLTVCAVFVPLTGRLRMYGEWPSDPVPLCALFWRLCCLCLCFCASHGCQPTHTPLPAGAGLQFCVVNILSWRHLLLPSSHVCYPARRPCALCPPPLSTSHFLNCMRNIGTYCAVFQTLAKCIRLPSSLFCVCFPTTHIPLRCSPAEHTLRLPRERQLPLAHGPLRPQWRTRSFPATQPLRHQGSPECPGCTLSQSSMQCSAVICKRVPTWIEAVLLGGT